MLETLIQQSPLSGTELEIAYRHELTLDHDSEDSSYYLVTRKSDGARLWLKASRGNGQRKPLADECRLLGQLNCQGIAPVVENGTDRSTPFIAFRYLGEVPCSAADIDGFVPLDLLGFSLSLLRLVHCLETTRPPVAMVSFGSAPLLVSPMLKQPRMLGLGRFVQTASKDPHRKARETAWRYVAGALEAVPEISGSTNLLHQGEHWVTTGPEAFDSLHQSFNASAFKLSTQDL